MLRLSPLWRRRLLIGLALLIAAGLVVGFTVWYKVYRDVPQSADITGNPDTYFLYGSVGGEGTAGVPYWIWVVLPRVFKEEMPGPGGYAAFGVPWEEGREMPVGFSKKTIGFDRVGNNCALCHAATWRTRPEETPHIAPAGPAHTNQVQKLIQFYTACAHDPRFNGNDLMAEIDQAVKLSWLDHALYKYVFIPRTRQALLDQETYFGWTASRPAWGPGRDDPMNLTKFSFLHMPEAGDQTTGNADFPAIWNLKVRERADRPDMVLNWDGATPVPRSVIIDSALGLHGDDPHPNTPFFRQRMVELEAYLKALPPPRYPLPVDAALVAAGKPLFDQRCAYCHATPATPAIAATAAAGAAPAAAPAPPGQPAPPGRPVQPAANAAGRNLMGTVIAIAEIKTDRSRLDTWTQAAADKANATVASFGIQRKNMTKTGGYVAVPLDGIWLRGPYLHNGSVPTVADLLAAPAQRPQVFFRGYDLVDPVNLGFASAGPLAERAGWRFDTREPGNGNGGHLYGIDLAPTQKRALIEYLKTL